MDLVPDKYAIYPVFKVPKVLLSFATERAKLFAEKFCENSNRDDSGVSFPFLPSRTNLKLHNIPVNSHNSYKVYN